MNEVINAIHNRRSIRRFTDKPVTDAVINELITAGCYAPSGHNAQPWHFIVVRSDKIKEKIMAVHNNMQMLKTAPAAIIICADINLAPDRWCDDCGGVMQNILLAAYSLGLGSVYSGIHHNLERAEKIAEILNLPDNIKPFAGIPIGYPDEEKAVSERLWRDKIHYDIW